MTNGEKGFGQREEKISNKEQGMMNFELPSIFDVPCSLFDIPIQLAS
jgi:hypothetical protein